MPYKMKILATAVKATTLTYRLTTVSLLLAQVLFIVYKSVKKRNELK
jgi:hypothetical protein